MRVQVVTLPAQRFARQRGLRAARDCDHAREDLEGEDDPEEQSDLERRLQHRQRHVADALEEAGAEHLRRLAEFLFGMPWSPATRMIMMKEVERHISVSTTSPSSQFEWLGSIQIFG